MKTGVFFLGTRLFGNGTALFFSETGVLTARTALWSRGAALFPSDTGRSRRKTGGYFPGTGRLESITPRVAAETGWSGCVAGLHEKKAAWFFPAGVFSSAYFAGATLICGDAPGVGVTLICGVPGVAFNEGNAGLGASMPSSSSSKISAAPAGILPRACSP